MYIHTHVYDTISGWYKQFPNNSWDIPTFMDCKHMLDLLLGNWALPTPPSQSGCGDRESKAKEGKAEWKRGGRKVHLWRKWGVAWKLPKGDLLSPPSSWVIPEQASVCPLLQEGELLQEWVPTGEEGQLSLKDPPLPPLQREACSESAGGSQARTSLFTRGCYWDPFYNDSD